MHALLGDLASGVRHPVLVSHSAGVHSRGGVIFAPTDSASRLSLTVDLTIQRRESPMIVHESSYREWLPKAGVGKNDRSASSPKSYISYLNTVSKFLCEDISPALVSTETDVRDILERLEGRAAAGSVSNYGSALRQYVRMVEAGAYPGAEPAASDTMDVQASPRARGQVQHSIEVQFQDGTSRAGTRTGNNAAWICWCGWDQPLVGYSDIENTESTASLVICRRCRSRYRVVAPLRRKVPTHVVEEQRGEHMR